MSLAGIFALFRLFAGDAIKWILKGASAVFNWFAQDWRNFPLTAFFIGFQVLAWCALPDARSDRDAALADADENLKGWIAERDAHAQSIDNIRAASARELARAEANAARVQSEERAINERNARDFKSRYDDLYTRYTGLVRLRRGREAADFSAGASGTDAVGVSGARAVPGRVAEEARDPRLSQPSAERACPADRICLTLEQAWIASVQALQLDALITTIEERQAVMRAPELDNE